MAVTIHDLADQLNLSITTVSRALDGYVDVAEETRKRVVEAAKEMGYVPNFTARQLRRHRTDAIGYIMPTSSPRFTDPFYVNFLTGLCDEVASQHFDLIITSCPPDSETEKKQYRQWVQSRRVDGIIINRTRLDDWRIDYLTQNKIPFVSLGREETVVDYPHINIRDTEEIAKLVSYLVEKGHRRIAFIGTSPELVVHNDRYNGYRQGLAEAKIAFDPSLVLYGDLTEESGYQIAMDLLIHANRPTAIIGCNDLIALGVLRAANERAISVGTELAIAGYDGIKETEYTNPPLTTIHQPTYEIARELARMLVNLIEGNPLEQKSVTIDPELIIRASTS